MSKQYVNTSYGQVHVRVLNAQDKSDTAPLVCLHPAPMSGLYFATVMPLLNADRDVVAPDYPGYGGSDPQYEPPDIADYAHAMLEAIDALGIGRPVDVLGFHTGCLVAVEMAHLGPTSLRRLVLCDVPYFTAEQQNAMRDEVVQRLPLSQDLLSLEKPWTFNVGSRVGDVPLERALELFTEHLRAGTRDWYAFDAAFRYDCVDRFSNLRADVACLATQSGLHGPTTSAAAAIPDASYTDVTEVTSAVFESGADAISKRILSALGSANE